MHPSCEFITATCASRHTQRPRRQCLSAPIPATKCAVKTTQHDVAISLTWVPVTQGVIFRIYEVDIALAWSGNFHQSPLGIAIAPSLAETRQTSKERKQESTAPALEPMRNSFFFARVRRYVCREAYERCEEMSLTKSKGTKGPKHPQPNNKAPKQTQTNQRESKRRRSEDQTQE